MMWCCFTQASSPACTELETIVMDWLGKVIGLPSVFLHSNEQTMGGGVIQVGAVPNIKCVWHVNKELFQIRYTTT